MGAQVPFNLNYMAGERRPRSAAKWLLLGFVGLMLWLVILTVLLKEVRTREPRWIWGFAGPLLYTLPVAITLATWFPRRWHALWLAPLAYPLSVSFIYESILFAEAFPHFTRLVHFIDPRVQPGSEAMGVSLLFAAAPTVLAIVAYLGCPRAGPNTFDGVAGR